MLGDVPALFLIAIVLAALMPRAAPAQRLRGSSTEEPYAEPAARKPRRERRLDTQGSPKKDAGQAEGSYRFNW